MNKAHACLLLGFTFTLTACGTQIGLSGQAREDYLNSIKAYIEYWEKPGMTVEGRREDSWSCGAARTIHAADQVVFPSEVEKAERRSGEKNEMAAFWRLRDKWNQCMEAKGYAYATRRAVR